MPVRISYAAHTCPGVFVKPGKSSLLGGFSSQQFFLKQGLGSIEKMVMSHPFQCACVSSGSYLSSIFGRSMSICTLNARSCIPSFGFFPQRMLFHSLSTSRLIGNSSFSKTAWSVRKDVVVRAGTNFAEFMRQVQSPSSSIALDSLPSKVPYLEEPSIHCRVNGGRMYVETYGCQMNINDMEIVLAIMKDAGYTEVVDKPDEADIIFVNTCAIRDNAEAKVWQRLNFFKHLKTNWKRNVVKTSSRAKYPPKVAVLGCMAERLKTKLIEAEKMVDVVCGPDAYRDLPRLLAMVDEGQTGINTILSLEETYADVSPIRMTKNAVSAYVSIMRGCNNMCSFCIVPFTRGRERSRPVDSIVREVGELWGQGIKEVVLLGQNVNSYNDLSTNHDNSHDQDSFQPEPSKTSPEAKSTFMLSSGFTTIYKVRDIGLRFSDLLDRLSLCYPQMRFRFTSPHPKDFPDDLLFLMKDRPNICKAIHLPAQSGSSTVLERMRRGYTRESYLRLVDRIRTVLPDVSLSSDFITGFCGETEDEHLDSLTLMETVGYDMAYMFAYSMREKTHAHRTYADDVPEFVKQRRLSEMIETFRSTTGKRYVSQVGTTQLVLIDGPNKRNPEGEWIGRSDKGHRVIMPNVPVFNNLANGDEEAPTTRPQRGDLDWGLSEKFKSSSEISLNSGDYVQVEILGTTTASLKGRPLARTGLIEFYRNSMPHQMLSCQ